MGKAIYSSAHDRANKPLRKQQTKKTATVRLPEPQPEVRAPLSTPQRIALRAEQLRNASGVQSRVLDDPDIEIQDPRGEQGNQVDGETVFPMVRGPQPTKFRTRTLPDNDLVKGERFAAISLQDQYLLSVDDAITQAYSAIRNLSQKAEELLGQSHRNGSTPQEQQVMTELRDLSTKVLEPWLLEVESRMTQIIQLSGQE